jgi:hypothetical protein
VGPEEAHFLIAACATASNTDNRNSMAVVRAARMILIHISLKTHFKFR